MNGRIQRSWSWAKGHPAAVAAGSCVAIAILCVAHLCTHAPPWELDRLWERHAALKPAKIEDYMAFGLWAGAAVAAAIALALAASARWWARPPTGRVVDLGEVDAFPRRRFWLIVGIILLAAAALRAPRLGQSLWGDEAWAYSDLMGGRYAQSEDGSLSFAPHSWEVTFFWDKGLNNQYLFTAAARASNDIWRKLAGAPPHAFSETALRMPSFVAGLLSIAVAAGLLRRFGHSRAGLALALLLCINPWHLRYGAEARSYAMLILFLALALLFLSKAMATDRRRWWAAFAASEFAALYAWKAAVHPLAAINIAALLVLFLRLRRGALVPSARCLAANGFALMAFVPLFAPAIPQIALNLEKSETMHRPLTWDWLADVWSQVLGAMDWSDGNPASPFRTVERIAADSPLPVVSLVLVVVPALALFGLYRIWRSNRAAAALLVAPLFGSVLAVAHFTLNETYILKWYLFYAMPVVMAALALALTAWRPKRGRSELAYLPLAVFVAVYLAVFGGQIRTLIGHPLSDTRSADRLARSPEEGFGALGPTDHITVGVYRRVVAYDPRMIQKFRGKNIRDAGTLQRVLRDADANGKTLRLTVANLPYALSAHADLFELLADGRYFAKLASFPAIEHYIQIDVYEYRSGSLPPAP